MEHPSSGGITAAQARHYTLNPRQQPLGVFQDMASSSDVSSSDPENGHEHQVRYRTLRRS